MIIPIEYANNNSFNRYLLSSALKEMEASETLTEAPKDCNSSGAVWDTGRLYFEYFIPLINRL